jgi:hypothetical protein
MLLKITIITSILVNALILNAQNHEYYKKYSETLSTTKQLKEIYKYAFMAEEFVTLCMKDTSLIEHYIFKRENYSRTKGEEYYYDMSMNMLKSNLMKLVDKNNQDVINLIISKLHTIVEPKKPDVNWGKIFEVCETCYFGTYPADIYTYFNFSLIFMSENEIIQMIKYSNGEQWKYALMAIKGEDSFTIKMNSKYGEDILDRRIATYIIERWKDSKIKEVQELIKVYRSVM